MSDLKALGIFQRKKAIEAAKKNDIYKSYIDHYIGMSY